MCMPLTRAQRKRQQIDTADEIEPTEAGKTAPLEETANEKASEPAATELKRAKQPETAATEPDRLRLCLETNILIKGKLRDKAL
eukprot:COSAG02_NODE_10854_length_1845_cov_9.034937_1_plen_84_part_00